MKASSVFFITVLSIARHTATQRVPVTVVDGHVVLPIAIGTPPQNFNVAFATGSSDLWVISSSSNYPFSRTHNRYNAAESNTSAARSGTFSIEYGDGASVSGPIYTDKVTISGIKVSNQVFSAVTYLSSDFDGPTDGTLGMAYPSLSNLGENPWFITAFEQGVMAENMFGVDIRSDMTGSVYFGGVDDDLFSGDIDFVPANPAAGFWQIAIKSEYGEFDAVIDTGSEAIILPRDVVKGYYDKIPGAKLADDDSGLYTFPCEQSRDFSFSPGSGPQFTIPGDFLNLGKTEQDSNQCAGAIKYEDIGLGNNVGLFGQPAMQAAYVVFSFADNTVGWARKK